MTHKKSHGCGCWFAVVILLAALVIFAGVLYEGVKRLYPQRFTAYVEASAQEFEIDPLLVYAFICTESGFRPNVESWAGARGLMQITRPTYSWIHSKLEAGSEENYDLMYDAETNIRYGCYYIATCMKRYRRDVATTAAAYHSGWTTVDTLLEDEAYSADGATLDVFPYRNMNRYVEKITFNYRVYQFLYGER